MGYRWRLALAASLMLCTGFGECQQSDTMSLIAGGFTLISPPSNLVAPGAIALITQDEHGRALLKILCGPRSNLGAMYSPRVSETMSGTYKMSRSQKISLEAEAIDRFRARTKVEEVESVSVAISRPKIIEVVESEVFERINNRTEACRQAIHARIDAGFSPTFITSAYIADIEYTVSFKRDQNLTKRIREERMQRIAANLGGGHTEITDHSLRGSNLVLAVRSDAYLMSIKPNGDSTQLPAHSGDGLGTPFAEVLPEPDVPYTPPAGGFVNPIVLP